ncbi:DUF6078 family protein [Bacteroides sp.]
MKTNFDYHSVPYNFVHCINKQCLHAADCLRHQVALRIPSECEIVCIINPAYATSAGKDSCKFFKADKLMRFASGITHLLDSVPHSDAIVIKQQMLEYFGRNSYYRFLRKERLVNPSEQKYIRQLFHKRGITNEPVYDEYVERYEW